MTESKPLRAVLNGVTVTFGVIYARVDLMSVQQSKATRAKANIATRHLCPDCDSDDALVSKLWCEHGHGPFGSDQTRKGISTNDGELKQVSDAEVAAAKAPTIKERTADLSVFPACQVEAATMPSGNLFRLRSEPTKTYGLLLKLIENPAHAFVCEMVVKGKTCLYRAVVQGGTIVLVELVRPERMLPVEQVDAVVEPAMVEAASKLVDALLEEFVPEDWADSRQARLAELRERLSEKAETPLPTPNVRTATSDLLALLESNPAA